MKEFKDYLLNFLDQNSKLSGLLILIIAINLLIYKVKQKDNRNFDEHNIASWEALVNLWALIIILIIFGLFLILN